MAKQCFELNISEIIRLFIYKINKKIKKIIINYGR